jgi:hypothetical protein
MYISPQQHKSTYDGSVEAKPLPPFPIDTDLEENTKELDSSSPNFRYACGRKFLKDTGEECVAKNWTLTSITFGD